MSFIFPKGYDNPYGDQEAALEAEQVVDPEAQGNEEPVVADEPVSTDPDEDVDAHDEPTPEPTDDDSVPVDGGQQPEPAQEVTKEQEPIVVLRVRGRDYPVHDKEQLITLAQQGVDYATKMYNMKPWRYLIEAYTKDDDFKAIADKAIRGEDWKGAIAPAKEQPAPVDTSAEDESVEDYIKREVEKRVKEAVTPLKAQQEATKKGKEIRRFLDELRAADPENFDTVYSAMMDIYHAPDMLTEGVRHDIDTNPKAFLNFYATVRSRVVPEKPAPASKTSPEPAAKPAPATDTKRTEQLRQRKTPPPVLEGGRGAADVVSADVRKDADVIWSMSDADFAELVAHNERSYRSRH